VVTNDQRTQIRSYLVNQGAKWPVAEIGSRVLAAYDELAGAMEGPLTPAQLTFRPGPEEWSIVEVLSHCLASNAGTCRVAQSLAAGKDPERGEDKARTVTAKDEMPALIAESRDQVLRVVREFPENADLERTSEHPFFGPLNSKAWLLFLRVHTLDHANQIKSVRAHPRFPR